METYKNVGLDALGITSVSSGLQFASDGKLVEGIILILVGFACMYTKYFLREKAE